ncbi:relaxase/mobilization nuclease domain-containing protein [Mycoplana dimorpha]|nr:hypothetical protein [Mycoplana dimorpha]
MQMIIKGMRFRSRSTITRLIRHLQCAGDNEAVCFLRGTAADIRDMHADAVAHKATYSVRHWVVAPHEAMDRQQMLEVLEMLAREFKFEPTRAVVVEHRKARSTGDAADVHWHILVGEIDPITGRVLKSSFDRILHELVARWSEYRFGHKFVPGKHTASIIKGLHKRGYECIAIKLEQIAGLVTEISPEAFTHAQHQEKKRLGIDLPNARNLVAEAVAKAMSRTELAADLAAFGLTIEAGSKPATWIVNNADGVLVGALHRLARRRKSEIISLMEKTNVITTSFDRTGNTAGYTSHPAIDGAQGRSSDDRGRDAYRDTEQGSRHLRADSFGHSAPPSAAQPGGKSQRRHLTTPLLIGLDKLRAPLSEMLGRANASALTSAESIVFELGQMEEEALRDLRRPIPEFSRPPRLKTAKNNIQTAQANLTAATNQRWDIAEQLLKTSKVRWWYHLVGIAARRRGRVHQLKERLSSVDAEVRSLQHNLAAAQSALRREERATKDEYAARVQDIIRRQKAAQSTLRIIEAANAILRSHPEAAHGGLQFILGTARKNIDFKCAEDDDELTATYISAPLPKA